MSLKEPEFLELQFMYLEIYPHYVISTLKEGHTFDLPQLKKLNSVFRKYYGIKPFVSIANREFDCTINPTIYLQSSEDINLRGIAVLAKSKKTAEIAAFERKFYTGAFKIFSEINDCINWAETLLKEEATN